MSNAKCKSGDGPGQEHGWNSGLRVEPGTRHLEHGTDIRGQRSVPIAIGVKQQKSKLALMRVDPFREKKGREGVGGKSFLNDKCRMSNAKCKSGRGVGRSMNGTAA